jgi:hypothetical protein
MHRNRRFYQLAALMPSVGKNQKRDWLERGGRWPLHSIRLEWKYSIKRRSADQSGPWLIGEPNVGEIHE